MDANLELLKDKTIVFVGYVTIFIHFSSYNRTLSLYSFGNQGAAQAQNLRDSGIPNSHIIVANRVDSYAEDAVSKGFTVDHDFGKVYHLSTLPFRDTDIYPTIRLHQSRMVRPHNPLLE